MSGLRERVSGSGLDVGFICQGWRPDPGGVESHTSDLAEELSERGHRVHVLCLDAAEDRAPYSTRSERVRGVEVRRMAYRYHDQRALADLARRDAADDAVMAWLAETPCDVVHVHHLTGFGAGALQVLADLGRPCVATLHDYWMLCPRGQMMRRDGGVCERAEPHVCAPCIASTWPHLMPSSGGAARGPAGDPIDLADPLRADVTAARLRLEHALSALRLPQRLVTPSAAARDVLVESGVEASRIEVVPNGIARARFARIATPKAARETVHLGVLGAVQPSKGVLELARAVAHSTLANLVLDVHGPLASYHGDDAYVRALRQLADTEPRVRLHGEYAAGELAGILAGLDGVAAPSLWNEVFGLTVREARAAGLPVIVSDRGGLAEWARAGARAGEGEPEWIVPAGDAAAWTRALELFAGALAVRQRWCAEAPAAIADRSEMASVIERIYIDAIEAESGRVPEPGGGQAPAASPRRGLLRRLFGR